MRNFGKKYRTNYGWMCTRGLCTVLFVSMLVPMSACSKKEMLVARIDPTAGATQGDQPVRIYGQNFRPEIGYTVYFGGRKAPAVIVLDEQTLLVKTPSQEAPSTVDITVRVDDGHAFRIAKGFRYENMAGSVIGNVGSTPAKSPAGNRLAY